MTQAEHGSLTIHLDGRQFMLKDRPYTLWILLGAGVLTIGLQWVPFGNIVLYPLLLFSTYAHELGHAIAAWSAGGTVQGVSIWSRGGGVAHFTIAAPTALQQATTVAGGLLGPSLVAMLFLWLGLSKRLARGTLLVFGIFALTTALLVMENVFGRLFAGGVGVIALFIALKASEGISQFTLLFVALQLALSVYSRSDYLFKEVASTEGGQLPSDVGQLSNVLGGPYWLWGALLGLASVAFLAIGFLPHLLRKETPSQPAASEPRQQQEGVPA